MYGINILENTLNLIVSTIVNNVKWWEQLVSGGFPNAVSLPCTYSEFLKLRRTHIDHPIQLYIKYGIVAWIQIVSARTSIYGATAVYIFTVSP